MQEEYRAVAAGPLDAFDEQPPLTEVQRLTNTFAAPTRTFADVRRNRSWWLPFVVVVIFSYLFTFAAMSHIGPLRLAESAIRNNPSQNERMQQASPEQRQQTLQTVAMFMKVSFYSWPVLMLLIAAVGGLLLWVGFNFILGGTGTFAAMFAVMMFSFLPGIFRSLLSAGMLFLGDAENFNLNDPIGTNPGFYLGADASPFLKALLSSIDLFSIWTLALMAVGGAIVARVKIRNGVMMVFTVWLLFILGKAAIAAATS